MHCTRSPRAWGPSMVTVELSLSFRETGNVKKEDWVLWIERGICGCSGMSAELCALLMWCSGYTCLIGSSLKVVKKLAISGFGGNPS